MMCFKDIQGHEGRYEINENGEVRHVLRGRILKPRTQEQGQQCLTVSIGNYRNFKIYPHREVYKAFIGSLENRERVAHLDGNKENNHFSNLIKTTDIKTEGFKQIANRPLYLINKDGVVISSKGSAVKILTQTKQKTGYLAVRLDGQNLLVQKLLYEAYIGVVPDGFCLDHIDGNRNNNSLSNLRICSKEQNNQNRSKNQTRVDAIPFKGVYKTPEGRYESKLKSKGVRHYMGRFDSMEEAAIAYNERALQVFGDFARLNEFEGVTY